MATSEEVTQYAGASRATVSQAFNRSARVSVETRMRVQLVERQSTGTALKETQ